MRPTGPPATRSTCPTAGLAHVVGNLVQKGPRAENRTLVAYGAESLGLPENELYVLDNALVNDRREGRRLSWGWRRELFVRMWGRPARVRIANNLLVGPGLVLHGTGEVADTLRCPDRRALAAPAGPR